MIRYRHFVLLAMALYGCTSGSSGCAGCPGTPYVYPRSEAGKEPVENAAQVRINQAAIDFVKDHMTTIFDGMCCDYDTIAAAQRKETPAETCWGQAPCFLESESGERRLHFYMGSPGAPISFTAPVAGDIVIRNGDPLPLVPVFDSLTTPDALARPYCNDLGGDVFARAGEDLDRFCLDPAAPANAATCNNPATDYCCGGLFHGYNVTNWWPPWNPTHVPTTKLDVCYKNGSGVYDRAPKPRASGYPSNVSIPVAQLTNPGNIELSILQATASAPAGIGVSLSNLDVSVDMSIALPGFQVLTETVSVACTLQDEGTTPTLTAQDISFSIRPRFVRNAPELPAILDLCPTCVTIDSFDFNFNGPDVNPDRRDSECQDSNWFNDRGVGTFYVSPATECVVGCGATNFALDVVTPIFDVVQGLITGPLVNALSAALVGQLNGTPVEIQTKLDVRALISQLVDLRFGKPVGVLAGPNGNGFAANGVGASAGLKISVDVGAESEHELCVPQKAPPVVTQSGDPNLQPTVTVQDTISNPPEARTDIYHAAAAISAGGISRAMYAAFNSGLLCIGIGTDDVLKLTNGGQVITAGLLFLLAPDLQRLAPPNAPIFFELEPKDAPTIAFGSGQPTGQTDANGKAIVDSLVKAGLHDLGLSFYVFVDNRMVRVFGIDADVDLGLNVVRAPNNALKLSIDKISVANVRTTFSELVDNDFAGVVTSLIDVAMSTLLQGNLSFDLNFDNVLQSAFGGAAIYMKINDVQRAGNANDFLAVYMTLCDEADTLDITNRVCCDQVKASGLCGTVPVRDELSVFSETPFVSDALPLYALPGSLHADTRPTGVVAIHVEAPGPQPRLHRYGVKIDGGALLSPAYPNERGDLIIDSPRLQIAGTHKLQLLADKPGEPESLGAFTSELSIEIDPERPRVWITENSDSYTVDAEDLVTEKEALVMEARFVDLDGRGAWQRVARGERLYPSAGARSIEARAYDRAKNVSSLAAQAIPVTKTERSGCACGASAGTGNETLLLGVLVLLLRRRCRRV
jgi:hypothetical protein